MVKALEDVETRATAATMVARTFIMMWIDADLLMKAIYVIHITIHRHHSIDLYYTVIDHHYHHHVSERTISMDIYVCIYIAIAYLLPVAHFHQWDDGEMLAGIEILPVLVVW